MKTKLHYLILMALGLMGVHSCANFDGINPPTSESSGETINPRDGICEGVDSLDIEIAYAIGEFIDGVAADGLDSLIERWERLDILLVNFGYNNNTEDIPFDTLSVYFDQCFLLDEGVAHEFFKEIHLNSAYILDENNSINLYNGLYCYASNYNPGFAVRGLFTWVLNNTISEDYPCSFGNVYGRVMDAVAATLGVPIGGNKWWRYMSGAAAVYEFCDMISYAIDC